MILHLLRTHLPRVAAASAALLCLGSVSGTAATISDGIATITVDDADGSLTDFILSGRDHLFEADYYFRTGSMTSEGMLTGVNSTYINSVTASGNDIMVTGSTSEFDFTLTYHLDGAGNMAPRLDITNTSGSQLDLNLFNYQDWDVNGSAGGDRISWNGSVATVSQGPTDIRVTPFQTPNAVQASGWPTLRNSLRDGSATTLVDGAGLPFGPGDGTFAFEFVLSLASGESTIVTYVVPEPSTGLLGAVGLVILAWSSRRRRFQQA
jgi:hypothetical protein